MSEHSSFAPATVRTFRRAGMVLAALALLLVGSTLLPSREHAATSLTARTAHDVVTLTIDQPRTGNTTVDVRLSPVTPARKARTHHAEGAVVTLQAVLPTAGHAGPETAARSEGGDRYQASHVHLMMPGRWTFLVTVDRGATREQYEFPVTVSGG